MKWKQHVYSNTCWNNLLLNMAVRLGCILGDGRGTRKEGALMSNLYLISHQWYDVEKLTVPGSSNLNLFFMGTAKSFVLKRWKKNVLHFFIKFNEKFSPKSCGERWYSCAEVRSLLSKLIFIHLVSCRSRSHEIMKK